MINFPGADEIARAILDGLGDVIRVAFDQWWDTSGPVVFGRMVSLAVGALVTGIWTLVGPLFSTVNFITHIPPQWSYELPFLIDLRNRLRPLGMGLLGLGIVLNLLWGAASISMGRPIGRMFTALPRFVLATGGLMFAPQLMEWWVRFCNAAADAMGATTMPALDRMETIDRLSAVGVVSIVWILFALWFLVARIKIVALAIVLLAAMPFAIPAGALPFPQAQRFFNWWLTTFLAVTFVQVLQSLCLAIGGYMLSAPVVTGGALSDPTRDTFTALAGIGIIFTASSLPKMFLGGLAGAGLGGGVVNSALHVATLLAATQAAGGFQAAVSMVRPRPTPPPPAPPVARVSSGGYVHSLLGSAPKALPPPKD